VELFCAKTIKPRHKPLFSINYCSLNTVSFSGLFCTTKGKVEPIASWVLDNNGVIQPEEINILEE
jgi:hypothetical protein